MSELSASPAWESYPARYVEISSTTFAVTITAADGLTGLTPPSIGSRAEPRHMARLVLYSVYVSTCT